MRLGYFRLGAEAVAFWESEHGDPRIDINWRTGRPYILGWRSDYSQRPGKSVVMDDFHDPDDMLDLNDDFLLAPVTQEAWIAFQRTGQWP